MNYCNLYANEAKNFKITSPSYTNMFIFTRKLKDNIMEKKN